MGRPEWMSPARRVLEVSCGHGGGASYLMRIQGPAAYTGLDLNPVGSQRCPCMRRKRPTRGAGMVAKCG
jgi:ubiquinone/menaquinone biosynthesis C-methylase UbiE